MNTAASDDCRNVGLPGNAAGLAMMLLCMLAPLELRVATASAAGLAVSAIEVLAALTIGLGGLAVMARAANEPGTLRFLLRPAPVALFLWAGVHVASAGWTTGEPIMALKFGLRVTGGAALAIIACLLADRPRFRARLRLGLLVGLGLLTVIAAAERLVGQPMEPFLRLFRDEPTWMLGEQRLSATFYHANTFAAYLELTLPFVLLLTAAGSATRASRWLRWTWLLACGAMLSLTYSRAGLVAGIIGAVALWIAARRQPGRQSLARVAAIFAVGITLAYGANPDMRARFGLEERTYKVRYSFFAECIGHVGEMVRIPMRISNIGQWPVSNRQAPGQLAHVVWSGESSPEPSAFRYYSLPDLNAAERHELDVHIRLPERAGLYTTLFDIRRKGILWIGSAGSPIGRLPCEARPADVDLVGPWDPGPDAGLGQDRDIRFQRRPLELSRLHYWQTALRLFQAHPWLGIGADRFRFAYKEQVPPRAWDERARAHSLVMETAANLGLLGLLALGLLAGVVGRALFERLWRRDRTDDIALAASAAVLAFGLHSLVDYFLGYTQILLIAWPVIGLVCADLPRRAQATDKEAPDGHIPA